jgi:hypothetical protein
MRVPEEDLPQFPVAAAEALAAELDRLAGQLEAAVEARVRAGSDLPEFRGAVADQFRADLDAHGRAASDVVDQFRQTAGRLRDAVEEHRQYRRHVLSLVSGSAA